MTTDKRDLDICISKIENDIKQMKLALDQVESEEKRKDIEFNISVKSNLMLSYFQFTYI